MSYKPRNSKTKLLNFNFTVIRENCKTQLAQDRTRSVSVSSLVFFMENMESPVQYSYFEDNYCSINKLLGMSGAENSRSDFSSTKSYFWWILKIQISSFRVTNLIMWSAQKFFRVIRYWNFRRAICARILTSHSGFNSVFEMFLLQRYSMFYFAGKKLEILS